MSQTVSKKQIAALHWIQKFGTVPPVEPRTWRSLIDRGLATYNYKGTMALTDAGNLILND